MKALVKAKPGKGAELQEVPVPEIKEKEVLVKVVTASICGTDLHIFEWDKWSENRIKPPLVFGHEFSGKVVKKGSLVKGLEIGDKVSAETHIACGHCFQCKIGNKHICESMEILGVDRNGIFAEFVALPEENAWKTDPSIPDEWRSVMEPFGNAVHTALKTDLIGSTVLITGCGPIGCMAVSVCKAVGAGKVIATDISPFRLDLAKKMGADLVLNPKESDVVKECLALTNGRGVDVWLEMSGAASAFKEGFASLRSGGNVSILGIPSNPVELDIAKNIVFKYATIYGINGRQMFETWFKSTALLKNKLVDLAPIITHTFKMEEFEKAFELMASGKSGKVLFQL